MSLSHFSPETKAFTLDHLSFFVNLSLTAYYDQATMLGTLAENKFKIPHNDIYIENEETDTQCFVFSHDSHIFIIFRGSESKLTDWKTNFTFHKKSWPGHEDKGEVHIGFYDAVESVWDQIQQKVEREAELIRSKGKTANIWVTGHSLGGALAQVTFTKYLLNGLPKNTKLGNSYVYASPRFASKKLAAYIDKEFNENIYRLIKDGDLIPRTPHRFAGYKNCFTLKFFNKKEQLIGIEDFSTLEKLSHQFSDVILFTKYALTLVPLINLFVFKDIIDAHSISDYARLCEELKEKYEEH